MNSFLCTYLLAICISSYTVMYIQVLCQFFNWTVCSFATELYELLYILDTIPLSDIWFANIFSHSMVVLSFVNHFFDVEKLFKKFEVVPCICFWLCCLCFRCHNQKNHCQDPCQRAFFLWDVYFNFTDLLLHISILCKSCMVFGLPLWLSW